MPGTSESQVVERLSKLNTNVRDSVKEIEELLKKDTGGLLNKQVIVDSRKMVSSMDVDTNLTFVENTIDILEEYVLLFRTEKKRREAANELIRIQNKGDTEATRKLKRLQIKLSNNPYAQENSDEDGETGAT
jgi:hypothetical protein